MRRLGNKTFIEKDRSSIFENPFQRKYKFLFQRLEKEEEKVIKTYIEININGEFMPLKQFINNFEKKIIIQILELVHGNQKLASRLLRIKPTTLNQKIKRYKIKIVKTSI